MAVATREEIVDIVNRFTYHPPHSDQAVRYEELRGAAKVLAMKIADRCPPSREKSLALTRLQEAVMWANAAIACNEAEPVFVAEDQP
jgi:hypothetical protein